MRSKQRRSIMSASGKSTGLARGGGRRRCREVSGLRWEMPDGLIDYGLGYRGRLRLREMHPRTPIIRTARQFAITL